MTRALTALRGGVLTPLMLLRVQMRKHQAQLERKAKLGRAMVKINAVTLLARAMGGSDQATSASAAERAAPRNGPNARTTGAFPYNP